MESVATSGPAHHLVGRHPSLSVLVVRGCHASGCGSAANEGLGLGLCFGPLQ